MSDCFVLCSMQLLKRTSVHDVYHAARCHYIDFVLSFICCGFSFTFL